MGVVRSRAPFGLGMAGWLFLAAAWLSPLSADAGYLVVSGDSNLINGLDGSDGFPKTSGNGAFFAHMLGGGKTVKVLSTTLGNNVDGTNQNAVVNTFYNSQAGVTSTVVTGPITAALLAGTNLLVDDLPDAALSSAEVAGLKGFLATGGSLLLLGEAASFAINQINFLNTDLAELGSGLRLGSASLDAGVRTTTSSQIEASPLTVGVGSLTYGFVDSVTGGSSLFLASDRTTAFVAAEPQSLTVVHTPSSLILVSIAAIGVASLRLPRRAAVDLRPGPRSQETSPTPQTGSVNARSQVTTVEAPGSGWPRARFPR